MAGFDKSIVAVVATVEGIVAAESVRTVAAPVAVEVDHNCSLEFEVEIVEIDQTARTVFAASSMGSLASVESAVTMVRLEFEYIRKDSHFELEEKSCIVALAEAIVMVVVRMDFRSVIELELAAWS